MHAVTGTAIRRVTRGQRLVLAGAVVALVAGPGCAMFGLSHRAVPEQPGVEPARVYAGFHFDTAPTVLNFGVQPLWIPVNVIWEVMVRDQRLQEDLQRGHCRLATYPFFKGQDLNDYLKTGKLQGGMAGDLPALKAAEEIDVRIVSLIQQGPCSIVAREPLPIEALRGRKIGYAPGSNAHYTLLRVLREHGLGPGDVRLTAMNMTRMADALAGRQIDAFSAWEPTPTLALLDHPGFEVLARTQARGFLYFTRRFFDRRPQVVRALVASEVRALRWLRTNEKNVYIASRWARERAVAFGGTELPSTVYDFDRLASRDILRVPGAPGLPPALLAPGGELEQQFRLAREFKLIAADARWERVRRCFAPEIVPELLHISRPGSTRQPAPRAEAFDERSAISGQPDQNGLTAEGGRRKDARALRFW